MQVHANIAKCYSVQCHSVLAETAAKAHAAAGIKSPFGAKFTVFTQTPSNNNGGIIGIWGVGQQNLKKIVQSAPKLPRNLEGQIV